MSVPNIVNADTAYMLGMLYGKGDVIFYDNNINCEFNFKIRYRRPSVDALRKDNINVHLQNINGDTIEVAVFNEFTALRRIFENCLGVSVDLRPIIPRNRNRTPGWELKEMTLRTGRMRTNSRILRDLFGCTSFNETTIQHIPAYFFDNAISRNLVLSFIQGFCDACALPPSEVSSAYGGAGSPRLQIEPNWQRWYIPVEICHLFQNKLNIPINMINWGHPLIRGKNSYRGQNHQIRIFLDAINLPLFRLSFKKDAFDSLIKRSGISYNNNRTFCPQHVRETQFVTYYCNKHNENDPDLPAELRGKHINHRGRNNVQICKLLGCTLCGNFDIIHTQTRS